MTGTSEPASKKHAVQAKTDCKTKKTSDRVQDQSQESQSTSSESDKEDINFTTKQLRVLEWTGRDKKKKPNSRSDNSSNKLNEN